MPDLDLLTHQHNKCVALIRRKTFPLRILFLAELKYLNKLFQSKWHVLIYDCDSPEEKVIYFFIAKSFFSSVQKTLFKM